MKKGVKRLVSKNIYGKGAIGLGLLLFFCLVYTLPAQSKNDKKRPDAGKIILKHADKVTFDQYKNPDMQIFVGNVVFLHNGVQLFCDSANFFQSSNSFKAFEHVKMLQGDTLSLTGDYLFYDGNSQIAEARKNVVLKHRKMALYTDSLNYDRVYNIGYFFEGGKLVDEDAVLTSDWGQYNSADKQAIFNYHVQMDKENMTLTTDTLHYDTQTKIAHMLGPSNVLNSGNQIYTEDGYYNTETKNVRMFNRSVLVDDKSQMVADTVLYDQATGVAHAYGDIFYNDKTNKNILTGNYCYHNDSIGFTIAYDSALVRNYSQKDTLYLHADTFKIFTYNAKTDSVYRIIHGYYHTRSYKEDMQSVADSLSYNSTDHKLSLFGNPIVWNNRNQILGEDIYAFLNDSTIDSIHVVNQALMVSEIDTVHYNQVAGKEMRFYFENGSLKENRVIGNVKVNYYADEDSILIGMNHTETTLLKMFMKDKKMNKMWSSTATNVFYPMAFVSTDKMYLENFAWFDYIRPKNKDDVFEWRAKTAGTVLTKTIRREVPFQYLNKIK